MTAETDSEFDTIKDANDDRDDDDWMETELANDAYLFHYGGADVNPAVGEHTYGGQVIAGKTAGVRNIDRIHDELGRDGSLGEVLLDSEVLAELGQR